MVEVEEVEVEEEVEDGVSALTMPPPPMTTAKGSEEERLRQLVFFVLLLCDHACETREASRLLMLLPRWLPRSRRRRCDISKRGRN